MAHIPYTTYIRSCVMYYVTNERLVVIHYTTSVFSGLTSDAHTPISIESCPKVQDINKFVVREVAADWKQVAISLGVEPSVISAADTNYQQCNHACTDIFERWLSWKPGTGRKKRTWCTVLSAVEEAGHKTFSQQLETKMF